MSTIQTPTTVTSVKPQDVGMLVKPVSGGFVIPGDDGVDVTYAHGFLHPDQCPGYESDDKDDWFVDHLKDSTIQFEVVQYRKMPWVILKPCGTKVPRLRVIVPRVARAPRTLDDWRATHAFLMELVRSNGELPKIRFVSLSETASYALGLINGGPLGSVEVILHWTEVCPGAKSLEDRIEQMEEFLKPPQTTEEAGKFKFRLNVSNFNDSWKVGDPGRPYRAALVPVK